ncbi:DUF4306 domain-containing protein [Bacillus gobiensis]|uniref:DUF4306 domain-containing protein n=1 Tax=Bacillus gobiensis TaxID=1441095 RepID=UPI003D2492AE
MPRIIRVLVFLVMIPIFSFSLFFTSWTGSYLMISEDWKDHVVFTPKTVTDPENIFEIDKFLYAYQIQPIMSLACLLSFFILSGILIYWLLKIFQRRKTISL